MFIMITGRLNTKNKTFTPSSGTTVYVDYSAKEKTLEVEFDGGKVYHYYKVAPSIWKEYRKVIEEGQSSGVYVNTKIKPFYDYREVSKA
jgi:hypothetical protein